MCSRFAGLIVATFTLILVGSTFSEGQSPSDNLNAAGLHRSLRDVINTGADLFNLQGDYAGCYRLYQGSLIAIKPMLRPQLQGEVDKALSEAEKQANFADRANRLRTAIDLVRDQIKSASPTVPEPPTLTKPGKRANDGELIRIPPKKS